ncbi:MAG: hypothetical protein AVDCRST_MAG52-3295 [uncultured Blastococcus sp.]|uniref:Uncharacterized protein n=1 Tax=uncultured Blastococcus sp. TaxID=217144 RepID=A0A6J4J781_9ACTN|nr:MAG: hypothetical protein AVDCRST_MAG52-3295 [uncultured Blastococcus sp.]
MWGSMSCLDAARRHPATTSDRGIRPPIPWEETGETVV